MQVFYMKFSSTLKFSLFCCPLFFKEYLKPQVRINKMGNTYSVGNEFKPTTTYFVNKHSTIWQNWFG